MANIYQTKTLNKRGQELYELNQAYDKNDVVKVVTEYVNSAGVTVTATTNSIPTDGDGNPTVQKTFYYYYARNDVASGAHGASDLAPTISESFWGGLKETSRGKEPEFFWKPSYSSSVSHRPRSTRVAFGDGYEQRTADSINVDLTELSLTFDKKRKKEATAILHFLHARRSIESFLFSPPEPYNPIRQNYFVCRSWSTTFNFFDNYTISANFEQVAS